MGRVGVRWDVEMGRDMGGFYIKILDMSLENVIVSNKA